MAFYRLFSNGNIYNYPGGIINLSAARAAGDGLSPKLYFDHMHQSTQSPNSGYYICLDNTLDDILIFKWAGTYASDDIRGIIFGR